MKKNKNITAKRWLITNIKGLGGHNAQNICDRLGISKNTLYDNLSPTKLENLNHLLANIRKNSSFEFKNINIDNSLLRFNSNAIQRLIKINCHRGRRIKLGYPARGQRTRSNAITSGKKLRPTLS